MDEFLQTVAEIAAAFAGFASVVVIFRQNRSLSADYESKVTFQSMLQGALLVVFFALLPIVLGNLLHSSTWAFSISAFLLMVYILAAFIWAMFQGGWSIGPGALPYLAATLLIAGTQAAGLLGLYPLPELYLTGIFVLLTISGYAFYSLITFPEKTGNDN